MSVISFPFINSQPRTFDFVKTVPSLVLLPLFLSVTDTNYVCNPVFNLPAWCVV